MPFDRCITCLLKCLFRVSPGKMGWGLYSRDLGGVGQPGVKQGGQLMEDEGLHTNHCICYMYWFQLLHIFSITGHCCCQSSPYGWKCNGHVGDLHLLGGRGGQGEGESPWGQGEVGDVGK